MLLLVTAIELLGLGARTRLLGAREEWPAWMSCEALHLSKEGCLLAGHLPAPLPSRATSEQRLQTKGKTSCIAVNASVGNQLGQASRTPEVDC